MMRRFGVFVLWFCVLYPAPTGAYQWPVEGARLAGAFGQSSGDRLAVGVEVDTAEEAVRAIDRGEVVYWYDPARSTGSLPRGLGAHVVLQHAEHVRSVYAHLESGSLTPAATVGAGEQLGRMGDTGAALGRVLGLSLLDMEAGTWVNPLVVMPPLEDAQPPVVGRVYLRRAGGADTLVELGGSTIVSPGAAEVLVEAYDLRQDVAYRWRIAPYTLALSVNGRGTAAIRFDSIRPADRLLLEGSPRRAADALYAESWLYRLGEIQLQRGETRLEIRVADYAGNESTRELVLSIGG